MENKEPILLLKDNLLMPLRCTRKRIDEVREQVAKTNNNLLVSSLFIMVVSFFESMLRETLIYYLSFCPNKLPEKEIKISQNTLFRNEDYYILEHVISDYINLKSFKDLGNLFFNVLEIKRPTKRMIDVIVEIKDKRNNLIHNNLRIDYKTKNVKLELNIYLRYLIFCLDTYNDFLDYIYTEINNKYNKYTKINLLKDILLIHLCVYLCAHFDDYWLLDIEKDQIVALKHPKQEYGLSHSEKFMLDIWRSQFTNYKVEFLNMSSLGYHAQSCLYLFLKISNNLFMYQ